MDVFNQNWTQRMKTDPWTNAVLNSKRERVVSGKPRFLRYWRGYSQDEWNAVKYKQLEFEPYYDKIYLHHRKKYSPERHNKVKQRVRRNPEQYNKVEVVSFAPSVHQDPDMWENTRPQSLYNLRYASLR